MTAALFAVDFNIIMCIVLVCGAGDRYTGQNTNYTDFKPF